MTLLKPRTPTHIPIASGSQNFHARKIFFKSGEIRSIILSYTLKTTAIVPPETPGITFATPSAIPLKINFINSIS